MCGIVGLVSLNSNSPLIEKEILKSMCSMIKHRGPDNDGYYINQKRSIGMGHVRLSIIDLNSGQQPMYSYDNNLIISFNGEIYDYIEIRNRLLYKGYRFNTQSDTEVILNLYKETGLGFLEKLNGEFAFSIYDIEKDRLVIARDRFGVKPLYYTTQDNILRYSSEIKGIFGDRRVKRKFNHRTIYEQMMRADSGERTTFENVNVLPPGHIMIVENGEVRTKQYWDIDFPKLDEEKPELSMEYYSQEVKRLLEKAVKTRMVSDVEVGCFLSGGLDSSIIAAIMQENSAKPIKTFSIGFKDKKYDESTYAEDVSKHIGSEQHTLYLSNEDLVNAFPQANYHCEHLVQQIDGAGKYLLSKYASSYLKVVQVGEGADEAMLGYPWFKTAKLLNHWNKTTSNLLMNQITKRETARKGLDLTLSDRSSHDEIIRKFGYYPLSIDSIFEMEKIASPLLSNNFRDSIKSYNAIDIYNEDLNVTMMHGRHPIRKNQYEFLKKTFHMYLMQYLGGKTEMANSIEGRLPFVDTDFFNFAKDIPIQYQLFGLREKNLLKMAFKDMLPPKIINRYKHGYSSSILSSFLGDNSPEYFKEFLSEENIKKTGIFNYEMVEKYIKRVKNLNYNDQNRTLYERLIVFILSVQLMDDMFLNNLPQNNKYPIYS